LEKSLKSPWRVIPALVGIHSDDACIPAFAGMTELWKSPEENSFVINNFLKEVDDSENFMWAT
jgi:hypothetical protein